MTGGSKMKTCDVCQKPLGVLIVISICRWLYLQRMLQESK